MNKFLINTIFCILFTLSASLAYAFSKEDIKFPVSELNGCKSEAECRAFCDTPKNRRGVCWDFAKKYNLVSQEEVDRAEKFTKVSVGGGPGRCRNGEDCENFCDDQSKLDECLDFTEKNGLMSAEGLSEARKVADILKKEKEFPGGCRGKNGCFTYCNEPAHIQECFQFASRNGLVTPEIMAQFQSFSSFLARGETPGGCKSKDECESFCAKETNNDTCIAFAKKSGLITKEQAEMVAKTGGAGPGGCKSKDECTDFCNKGDNQQVCLQFAKEHNINVSFSGPGGCSDVDSCKTYCMAHADDATCKQYAGGAGSIKGPGGCKDEASCMSYCKANQSDPECQKMAGQYGGGSGGQGQQGQQGDHPNQQQSDQQQGQQQNQQGQQPQ